MTGSLHICFIIYTYGEKLQSIEDLLTMRHSLTGWCDALAEQGCKITVLVRFHKKGHLQKNNINYHFFPDTFGGELKPWQIPWKLHKRAKEINADIYHGHNMDKVFQHAHLKFILGKNRILLIQNHAERPKNAFRIQLQKYLLKHIDAFLFCAKGQEIAWQEHKIIAASSQIFYVMEASTHFQNRDKTHARQLTGLSGEPVFLWVGNLNANKDPLTILKAFTTIEINYPKAKLYMVYRFDDLIEDVKCFIQGSKFLKNNVQLLGTKTRNELEAYYNSADYFILGSHHEGCGYSLMESMACGCIPIVSNIDSFRMMTDNGRVGFLWDTGNFLSLEKAIQRALQTEIEAKIQAVQQYFDIQLSYKAIASQMVDYYNKLYK